MIRVFDSRIWVPALLVMCASVLVGCSGAGTAAPGVTPEVMAVVVAVWRGLSLHRKIELQGSPDSDEKRPQDLTPLGHQVRFFIRKRAERLHGEGVGQAQAISTISAEYPQVQQLHQSLFGWPEDPAMPFFQNSDVINGLAHVDLADAVQFYEPARPASVTPSDVLNARTERRKNSICIVWRAAGLEADLWKPGVDFDKAMKELLDRRLRIVEQMNWVVNSAYDPVNMRPRPDGVSVRRAVAAEWDSGELHDNGSGPWHDQLRRCFEYPEMGGYAGLPEAIKDQQARGVANPNWSPMADGSPRWSGSLNATRMKPGTETAFSIAAGPEQYDFYHVRIKSQPHFVATLLSLFTRTSDFWDRAWMYCDHVICALHLEALRFGRRRRLGQAGDDELDAMFSSHGDGFGRFRPIVGPPSAPRPELFFGGDPYFVNERVPDLQVGDHVIFWNSILYSFLSDGAWTLENGVIAELTAEWDTNDPAKGVHLAGHGEVKQSVFEFQRSLADGLNSVLAEFRKLVVGQAGPLVDTGIRRPEAPLVRWNPTNDAFTYEGVRTDPWWVRIPYDAAYRTLDRDSTLRTLPDAIEAGANTTAPPLPSSLAAPCAFFPLFFTTQQGKWKQHIKRRADGWTPSAADLTLIDSKFTGPNIPALYVWTQFTPDGAPSKPAFDAVRPRVA
jgi:hypothetical protein